MLHSNSRARALNDLRMLVQTSLALTRLIEKLDFAQHEHATLFWAGEPSPYGCG